MGKLNQKVAVVTGAARGIGRQIALTFAREGADIVISDVLVTEMEQTAREITNLGRKAIAVKTDVSRKTDVQNLIDAAIKSFSVVDILVNNAAVIRPAPLLDMTEEQWDEVININLKGVFMCTQAVARHMVKQKSGKIINISSIGGIGSIRPMMTNYVASKTGVVGLTKATAGELGEYGINVNAIAPGVIITDLVQSMKMTESELRDRMEQNKRGALLNRNGITQDIANLALFLASDDSSFITGQVICADGGRVDKI